MIKLLKEELRANNKQKKIGIRKIYLKKKKKILMENEALLKSFTKKNDEELLNHYFKYLLVKH